MAQDTHTKIIENAMELFSEKGYDAASMNQIAKKSGVSKGDIYHHFESKEELLVNVCEYAWMNMTIKELYNTSGLTKENFKDVLAERGKSYIQTLKKDPMRKKLAIALIPVMLRDENIKNQLMSFIEPANKIAEKMIDKGIELGAINSNINKNLLIMELFMLLDAIEMYVAFDVDFDLEAMWEDFIKKLL